MSENKIYTLESPEVQYLCQSDDKLKRVIELIGEIEVESFHDPFKFFIDTIVGQMLSNKVADVISDRLWSLFDSTPTPLEMSKVSIERLKSIGLSTAKANYILIFSSIIAQDSGFFERLILLPDQEAIKQLTQIRGIGCWSAKMYLIFVLEREDILPVEDGAFTQVIEWLYGVKDNTRSKCAITELCKHWHPYASIGARYLYKVLDSGLTKKPFSFY